jgi:hypothetical protein
MLQCIQSANRTEKRDLIFNLECETWTIFLPIIKKSKTKLKKIPTILESNFKLLMYVL